MRLSLGRRRRRVSGDGVLRFAICIWNSIWMGARASGRRRVELSGNTARNHDQLTIEQRDSLLVLHYH